MSDRELLQRIVLNPRVMAGKPVVRGTRLTVEHVLDLLAHGADEREILEEYQQLKGEDISACLLYASRMLSATEIVPATAEV